MTKHIRKYIAVAVIIAFLFQIDGVVFSQSEEEIVRRFQSAVTSYSSGLLEDSAGRLERLIDIIEAKQIPRKDILGQCCLLLGAICEEQSRLEDAKRYYTRAIEIGIIKVEGVNLDKFPLYKEIAFGEKIIIVPPNNGTVIPGPEVVNPKKKKFPWVWVVGGVLVIATVIILMMKKKKYTLTVETDLGITGTPAPGTYSYKKGERVNYSFGVKTGYSGISVFLDGVKVPEQGTIDMTASHTLTAGSSVNFRVDTNIIDIQEGKSATFHVKLSAPPPAPVTATITRYDQQNCLISVESGGTLSFNSENWNIDQPITLKSEYDNEDAMNGTALFRISADRMASVEITAKEDDKDKFTIAIIYPKDGQKIDGLVDIKVDKLSGLFPVKNLTLSIDNEKVATSTTGPLIYQWNTDGFKSGTYILTAEGTDTANNTATPITIAVKVRYL